ncbi:MAG: hypothetical protein ABJB10_16890, partial [Mesorhizobium sp.]
SRIKVATQDRSDAHIIVGERAKPLPCSNSLTASLNETGRNRFSPALLSLQFNVELAFGVQTGGVLCSEKLLPSPLPG